MPATANSLEASGARANEPGSLGVKDRANLLDQFFAGIRLRDETVQPAREHAADFGLFGESAAQDDPDLWIDGFEFIEDRVAIHHRKKVIEEDEVDFPAHLPIDLQCFDSIFRQDEAVVFEIENLPGTLENVLVVIDQENELALAFGIENESIARGVGVGRDFAKRNLRGNARAGSGR